MAAAASNFKFQLKQLNPLAIVLQYFDDSIIGYERNYDNKWVLTYSVDRMLHELYALGLDEVEAQQFLFGNVIPENIHRANSPIFRAGSLFNSILDAQFPLDDNYSLLTDACDRICLSGASHDCCECSCHKQRRFNFPPD